MVIIQDTREQTPLRFNHPYITDVVRKKLDVGDYGCEFNDGHEPNLYFERKSIGDLYGTMGKGYPRFKKEVARATESNSQLIVVVEGSLTDVAKGYKYSRMKPESMVKKLFTLWMRYNLLTVYCSSRKEMSNYITQTYLAIGREYVKDRKERK